MQVLVNIFVLLDVLQFEVDSFQSEHCCLSEVFIAALLEALKSVEDDVDKEVNERRPLIVYQDKKFTLKRLVILLKLLFYNFTILFLLFLVSVVHLMKMFSSFETNQKQNHFSVPAFFENYSQGGWSLTGNEQINICSCFWCWRLSQPGCLCSSSVMNVALQNNVSHTHAHTQLNSS